jgi:hypothetical protein
VLSVLPFGVISMRFRAGSVRLEGALFAVRATKRSLRKPGTTPQECKAINSSPALKGHHTTAWGNAPGIRPLRTRFFSRERASYAAGFRPFRACDSLVSSASVLGRCPRRSDGAPLGRYAERDFTRTSPRKAQLQSLRFRPSEVRLPADQASSRLIGHRSHTFVALLRGDGVCDLLPDATSPSRSTYLLGTGARNASTDEVQIIINL